MPSEALCEIHDGPDFLLTQPKPDLAVCFNRKAILDGETWSLLPRATKDLVCLEGPNAGTSRAFHFLTVEAKNGDVSVDNSKALYQCLNNASQTLHNFYEFFHDADTEAGTGSSEPGKHTKTFFEKVRVFSAVANTRGILIRIHRAVEVPKQQRLNHRLILRHRPEYRLNFEYSEFARLGEADFTHEEVFKIFTKIFEYARNELRIWITEAVNDMLEKFEKDDAFDARRTLAFYRHGQPYPQRSENPSRNSRTTSRTGKNPMKPPTIERGMQEARLNSFNMDPPSRQTTPRIANINESFHSNSQMSNGSNKRAHSQLGSESVHEDEVQDTRQRSQRNIKPKA